MLLALVIWFGIDNTRLKNKFDKYKIGFDKKFSVKNKSNELDLITLQSCNFDKDGNYLLTNLPTLFPNGIMLFKDPNLIDDINLKDITNISENHIPLQEILSYNEDILQKKTPDEIKKIMQDINEYMENIAEYLKQNSSDEIMKKVYIKLQQIIQYINDTSQKIDSISTDIETIGDKIKHWVKFIISSHGGLNILFEIVRPQIKQGLYLKIMSEISDQNSSQNSSVPFLNDACTLPPYILWQKCPPDSIPIGSKGYKTESCKNWYQKFSGSLLCQKIDSDMGINITNSKTFNDIIKVYKLYNNIQNIENKIQNLKTLNPLISELIADAIIYIDKFPKVQLARSLLVSFYSKFLDTFKDIENIFFDLLDVCNTLNCNKLQCTIDLNKVSEMLKRKCTDINCGTDKVNLTTKNMKNMKNIKNDNIGYLGSIIQPF